MQNNPRIPMTDKEVYAMAWMIGYIGHAPHEMRAIFPNETFEYCPSFIGNGRQQREWKSGYDSGTSFYSSHAMGDEQCPICANQNDLCEGHIGEPFQVVVRGTGGYTIRESGELMHCGVDVKWEDCDKGHANCYTTVCDMCSVRDYECEGED
jgi:hypothetical protein